MESAKALTLQELFDAGVHYGHQQRRWHPRMAPYIYGAEGGVHLLDLEKTLDQLVIAADFISQIAKDGKFVLFVGTKRQAKEIVEAEARRSGALFMTERWVGGLVTNFSHVKDNINRLNELTSKRDKDEFAHYTKRERLLIDREIEKLGREYGGVKTMNELPGVIVLASGRKEMVAVREANRAGIPVVAIVDTNVDPTPITYPIPANDDSRKALALIFKVLADAVEEGTGQKSKESEKEKIEPESAEPTLSKVKADAIDALGLSKRSVNALEKVGITKVDQLRKMTEADLDDVKGLGEKSKKEVLEKIQELKS